MRTGLFTFCFFLVVAAAIPVSAQDTVIGGIRVRFDTGRHMFPCHWVGEKTTDARAIPLNVSEIPRATGILTKAISKYPAGMVNHYLNRIYVSKSLQFYGYPYGGTYARKTLYLTLDETNPLNTDRFMEERFHHELSSILWKEHYRKLDLEKWASFNAPGFVYGEGGLNAIRSGIASMDVDPGYFAIGFINRYAMTEVEQDLNVIAQNLFTGGPGFWKIVDENERIRGKTMLLIAFYQMLDPMFSETYFRNIP